MRGQVGYTAPTEIQFHKLWKYMLSAYLEFDTGADISELSSKYFYDDEFGGSVMIITNGYDMIAGHPASSPDIRMLP
jgi:hypothetical protein